MENKITIEDLIMPKKPREKKLCLTVSASNLEGGNGMKQRLVFSVTLDERVNIPFSFQRTKGIYDEWTQWYLGVLVWSFNFLFLKEESRDAKA
jgi:hypothetical protein